MNIELKQVAKVSGEYKLRITKPDGSVQETDWMKNLVLDTGLDYLGAGGGYLAGYAFVGTGTSTPLAGQTQLDGQLAVNSGGGYTPTASVSAGAPTYERMHTFTYTFTQGSVVGNITELGVGPNNSGTNLFSRALIVDGDGSPISLSVVALDQLTVFYRIKITPPVTDHTGSFNVGSTTYNYTARLGNADNFASNGYIFYQNYFSSPYYAYACGTAATLSGVTGSVSDGISGGRSTSFTAQPYVPGSFQRQCKATWGYAQGNSSNGGIQGFNVYFDDWGASMLFQYVLDAPIPKTNTQELQLNFVFSWARG